MRNPFKKLKKEEPLVFVVPLGTLARQAVFDTRISDPQTLSNLLGMPPMSEDVAEMEDDASLDRVESLSALYPLISLHSDVMADAMSKYLARSDSEILANNPDIIDDYETFLKGLCAAVTTTSCVSLLSVLNEHGLIHIVGANPRLIKEDDE
jgi:hypothetical protein